MQDQNGLGLRCPKNLWPCRVPFLYPKPPCRSSGSPGLGHQEGRETERQRGDLEAEYVMLRGRLCIYCGFPSSLNTTLVTLKCSMSSTNWSFLFVAVGCEPAGLVPKDGWRGPGQVETPRLVGVGLVPSGCWDEIMGTLPMEGRAENRDGSARLGQWW